MLPFLQFQFPLEIKLGLYLLAQVVGHVVEDEHEAHSVLRLFALVRGLLFDGGLVALCVWIHF